MQIKTIQLIDKQINSNEQAESQESPRDTG